MKYMAENVDKFIIKFEQQGAEQLNSQIKQLELNMLNLSKKINTATNNKNLGEAKGFKTQKSNLQLQLQELKLGKKYINEVSKNKLKGLRDAKMGLRDSEMGMMKMQRGLLQFGLSIMFFGMMMQKFFSQIAQASLTTFNKLNADTSAANNTVNRLTSAFEAVQYAIGDAINSALGPFEEIFQNILQNVIDFIDEHPNLIAWGVAIGLIVGAAMALAGQILLLIIGIAALKIAFPALASTGAGGIAKLAGAFGLVVAKIVGVIAIFMLLIGLLTGDKTAIKIVRFVIVIIAKIIAMVIYLGEQIGSVLWNVFKSLGEYIGAIFKWAFTKSVNFLIGLVNDVINGFNNLFGTNIKNITPLADYSLQDAWAGTTNKLVDYFNEDFFSGERFKEYMTAAEGVGDMFERGMTKISDALKPVMDAVGGAVGGIVGSFNFGQDFADLTSSINQSLGISSETAEKQTVAADTNLESAALFNNAVNNFLNAVGNNGTGGTATSTYTNGGINYGFSTSGTGASN